MLNDKIIKDSIVDSFIADNKLTDAVNRLFELQNKEWSELKNNYDALSQIKRNKFHFNGFRITAQFNPGRLTSTSAKTDSKSIQNRKCFLCNENLPKEQKGILIDDELIILINPYPIFPVHLTIAHTKHTKQEILPYFDLFIEVTKKLGTQYTLLYNGSRCGASAPDHLHFQAGTKSNLPIEDDFHQLKNEYGITLLGNDLVEVYAVDDTLRKFISIETNDSRILFHTFSLLYKILEEESAEGEEPMMNIISSYEEDYGWRIIVFLRSKHRPDIYFVEGERKLLFSPAVVDVGGLCITPVENDFRRLNENLLKDIFNEVFIDSKSFQEISKKLGTLLSYDALND